MAHSSPALQHPVLSEVHAHMTEALLTRDLQLLAHEKGDIDKVIRIERLFRRRKDNGNNHYFVAIIGAFLYGGNSLHFSRT